MAIISDIKGKPSNEPTLKSTLRDVTALAIPSVIANLTTPLLSMADIAIMGHLGSPLYIAAIAVGGTMFNLLYWLLGFLRMGTSGLTAQAFGKNDSVELSAILARGMSVGLSIGVLFILLSAPLGHLGLRFVDPDPATGGLAWSYFEICIWGAPATLGMYVLTGWFLGMQSSKVPMWVSVFVNLVNIPLSLTLVYLFDMGIRGAAFGTLAAQWGGFLLAVGICLHRFRPRTVGLGDILHRRRLGKLFKINTDLFLRTLCMVAVTLWFTRVGAALGAVVLAANALLMQLFTLFSYFMDGFAFAGEALCGRYKGAGDIPGLRRTVKGVMLCGGLLAIVFTVFYTVAGQNLLTILSSDQEVLRGSGEFFWWAVTIPLFGFAAFAWDGIVTGTSDSRLMLFSTLTASIVFFAVWLATFPSLGNHGLWLAFILYLLVRGLFLTCAFIPKITPH